MVAAARVEAKAAGMARIRELAAAGWTGPRADLGPLIGVSVKTGAEWAAACDGVIVHSECSRGPKGGRQAIYTLSLGERPEENLDALAVVQVVRPVTLRGPRGTAVCTQRDGWGDEKWAVTLYGRPAGVYSTAAAAKGAIGL